MSKSTNIKLSITLLTISLTSCSSGSIGQAIRATNADSIQAAQLYQKAQQPLPALSGGRVNISQGTYLPALPIRSIHGDPLPASMANVSIAKTQPETIQQIPATLTNWFKIPVMLSANLTKAGTNTTSGTSDNVTPENVTAAINTLGIQQKTKPQAINTSTTANGTIQAPTNNPDKMALQWHGPYTGLLDLIDSKFNVNYTYNGSEILLSKTITRTFTVHALASGIDISQSLSGNGTGSSGGGGASGGGSTSSTTQTATSTTKSEAWASMITTISKIIGTSGTFTELPETGTVTVKAPPSVISEIRKYIAFENRLFANEITVTVQIVTVQLTNSDDNSLNFTAKTLTSDQPLKIQAAVASALSPGISIVSGGTSLAIQALSTLGRVATKTQSSITTMNGVIAPFQLTNTQNYVSGSTVTTSAAGVGAGQTQDQLQTSTVTTGFNIAVLPRIDFADGTVLLQYGISISALVGPNNGFNLFTSPDGTQSVQLADINQQAFINTAEVPDGDTMVITGYNQDSNTANETGTGTPGFFGLGGSQTGNKQREQVDILITPTILHINHQNPDS